MSKPNGITLGIDETGHLRMGVTRSDATTDAVWSAVEEARASGWTVQQFRRECAEAWVQAQRDEMKDDQKAWMK